MVTSEEIRIIHLAGNVNQKYHTVETQQNINSLTVCQCRINLHRTKRQEHRQQQRHALQGSEESQSIVIHSNMFRRLMWGVKHLNDNQVCFKTVLPNLGVKRPRRNHMIPLKRNTPWWHIMHIETHTFIVFRHSEIMSVSDWVMWQTKVDRLVQEQNPVFVALNAFLYWWLV